MPTTQITLFKTYQKEWLAVMEALQVIETQQQTLQRNIAYVTTIIDTFSNTDTTMYIKDSILQVMLKLLSRSSVDDAAFENVLRHLHELQLDLEKHIFLNVDPMQMFMVLRRYIEDSHEVLRKYKCQCYNKCICAPEDKVWQCSCVCEGNMLSEIEHTDCEGVRVCRCIFELVMSLTKTEPRRACLCTRPLLSLE